MTAATAPSLAYEPYQLDQVLSLLRDARECVTVRSIMLELSVVRGMARAILDEVVRRSRGACRGRRR